MDFKPSDEQRWIQQSAAEILAKSLSSEQVRTVMVQDLGYDEKLWSQVARELGWPALAVPEEYHGLGVGFVELMLVQEQLGAHLSGLPLWSTCAVALMLEQFGQKEHKAAWLGGLAQGEVRGACLWQPDRPTKVSEAGFALGGHCQAEGDGYRLKGEYGFALNAMGADVFLVAARLEGSEGESGVGLFLVPSQGPGIHQAPVPTMDQTRRLSRVQLSDVYVGPEGVLCSPDTGGAGLTRLRQLWLLAYAAEALGGCQRVLEMSCAFTQERVQFGRKLASFQVLKHKMADMMILTEAARSAVYYAALLADEGHWDESWLGAVLTAKAYACDGFFQAAAETLQLHGGVGFTWEYDVHLYFKRARTLRAAILNSDQCWDLWGQHLATKEVSHEAGL